MNLTHEFRKAFIQKGSTLSLRIGEEWKRCSEYKISNSYIDKHLRGDKIVGQILNKHEKKRFAVLDFDRPEGLSVEEFKKFINKTCLLFQCPKIPVQSSNSGDVHVLLYFKHASPSIIKDRIKGTLHNHKIIPRVDPVEVFVSNGNIRLPFGEGSKLLDSSLEPVNVPRLAGLELAIKEIAEFAYLPFINEATPGYKRLCRHSRALNENKMKQLDLIYKNGILEPGTCNDILTDMAPYFFFKANLNKEVAKSLFIGWIDVKNNGKSTDYNINPQHIYKRIESLIDGLNASVLERKKNLDRMFLERWTCEYIVETFSGSNLYKMQKAVFQLFKHIKEFKTEKDEIFLSTSQLVNEIGLHSENYSIVMERLKEDHILTMLSRGYSGGNCSNFKYVGPELKDFGGGYQRFSDFLYKNGYLDTYDEPYSKYMHKKIKEELGARCLTHMKK